MKILKRKTLAALLALSLLASLLPLGAQPALAVDAPATLYVGNQQVISSTETTYWKTNDSGALERVVGANDTSNNWNVKYDPNSATLTLSWATITGSGGIESTSQDAGIYALCSSNNPVSLTIKLIGTNTITGSYGIYVDAQQGEIVGANASLLIQNSGNDGSLEVSGSNHGIFVKSGTGNASVTIENASVDAKTTQTNSGYAGVYVMSGASVTNSPNISLSVDGGSLTASGTESSDGILFYVGSPQATGATTSLTVSENAIVDAKTGGIKASDPNLNNLSDQIVVGSGTSTNGGIVFDGTEGTVYGNVELQEDLEIGEGESLTIGKDASLTVSSGTTLTNNGTVTTTDGGSLANQGTINNSGTLPDTISGNQPPKITTESLTKGEVDKSYSQPLAATGNDTITWSVSGTLPAGLKLDTSTGTISGTPTTADTYTFTVTATNVSGSDSKVFTLTVTQPVTSVSLNESNLSMFTGGTVTLAARVSPDNATNKNVTWSSNNEAVATVDNNGKVTAKAAGTASITVTTEDGEKTATCTVTVTDKTYKISADTTALDFGSAYTGYTQPAAQTVTVKNTGNQALTLTQPASTNRFEVGTLSMTNLAAGETATFTVQPKAGLAAGTYSDTIAVTGNGGATLSITASFTVKSQPSYNPPTVSEETIDAIADAQPGETVTVDLSSGSTTLDKEVFEALAGKDVTLVIDLGDGVSWTVKGSDVPEDADFTDIDLNVTMNSDGIPVDVVNSITGERGTVQITLAHDGDFGFTMTLTAPLGKENAGYWANLYHYDEDAEALNFETAAEIDADGSVTIPFSHASQYAIVIDTHSHATVDVSDLFIDIAPDAWYKDAVQYAYDNGLMTGVSATEFDPEATTTRAMIVSILARLEGVTTAEAAGFADVDDEWYATAVNWAASVGVVNGYEDNTFRPNTAITREQLAAILMNYAAYKGEDVSNRASLANYTDQPSTWAQEAMQWAVAEGLISGVTNDELQPQGNATRAQVAAILQRYLEA